MEGLDSAFSKKYSTIYHKQHHLDENLEINALKIQVPKIKTPIPTSLNSQVKNSPCKSVEPFKNHRKSEPHNNLPSIKSTLCTTQLDKNWNPIIAVKNRFSENEGSHFHKRAKSEFITPNDLIKKKASVYIKYMSIKQKVAICEQQYKRPIKGKNNFLFSKCEENKNTNSNNYWMYSEEIRKTLYKIESQNKDNSKQKEKPELSEFDHEILDVIKCAHNIKNILAPAKSYKLNKFNTEHNTNISNSRDVSPILLNPTNSFLKTQIQFLETSKNPKIGGCLSPDIRRRIAQRKSFRFKASPMILPKSEKPKGELEPAIGQKVQFEVFRSFRNSPKKAQYNPKAKVITIPMPTQKDQHAESIKQTVKSAINKKENENVKDNFGNKIGDSPNLYKEISPWQADNSIEAEGTN